ncbi:hypothetical protein GCM10007036_34860 [Alsobacter metallidurans]|uniref:Uncharacterized protein n=1 Tax=Alsobacter metallidurans TaxID=340221 RepID=A0A917MJ09_9HYPH|nr:hypothetical protein GCM10007036_34860 [Alsobacter metallidurans]
MTAQSRISAHDPTKVIGFPANLLVFEAKAENLNDIVETLPRTRACSCDDLAPWVWWNVAPLWLFHYGSSMRGPGPHTNKPPANKKAGARPAFLEFNPCGEAQ